MGIKYTHHFNEESRTYDLEEGNQITAFVGKTEFFSDIFTVLIDGLRRDM